MGLVKHGSAQVQIADDVKLDPKAGTLTPEQVRHLGKAPGEVAPVLTASADAVKAVGGSFVLPAGVTEASLRKQAAESTAWDNAVRDAEVLVETLKQAKLLVDEQAYEALRKVNDQVKAQGKYNDQITETFAALTEFFTSHKSQPKKKTA